MSSLEQIVEQLRAAGHPALPEGHPIADGAHHRYGKRRKYWYQLREVMRAGSVIGYAGTFGHFDGNDPGTERFVWNGARLTAAEVAETRQRQREVEQAEAEKRSRSAKMAANRAVDQWSKASEDGSSAYLDRKQITPERVRFDAAGDVLVPMIRYDDGQRMVGLQKITPDGAKRFNKGMEKKGTSCLLGRILDHDQVVMIAEGYATARSIRMSVNDELPVLVCFDASGILSAATQLRAVYPERHLLICADDDWQIEQRAREYLKDEYGIGTFEFDQAPIRVDAKQTWYHVRGERQRDANGIDYIEVRVGNDVMPERRRRFENAGLKYAHEAAQAVGNASVIHPLFSDRGERKLTDFNDLHCEQGLDAVKAQIEGALLRALAPAAVDIRPFPELSSPSMPARGVDTEPPAARSAAAEVAEWDGREAENAAYTWEQDLARSEKGTLLPTLYNVHLILSNHKAWSGAIAQDDFSGRVMKRKPPPFLRGEVGEWTDMDDIRCVLWLSQKYGLSVRQDIVMNAVLLVADMHHFHDVREYLNALEWDETDRIRQWPAQYAHVVDSEYVQLAFMKWMIAAVARVMRPGVKVDNVLILEGKQGWQKSTTLEVLAGKPWFTDTPIQIGNKDTYAVMAGKWIIELAELDSLNKTDSSAAKSFFATATDRFRNFYGKRATDVHRQCVFAGSVNFDAYLKDESGNRRYWPLRCGGLLDIDGTARVRDQLWAEAVHMYRAGVIWWVTEDERPLFETEQAERYEGDVYEDKISRAIEHLASVTMEYILGEVLHLETSKWTLPEQRRIGKVMKVLGWVRKRETTGKRGWYYVPPAADPVEPPPPPVDGDDDESPL